jgi:uncharacterized delta-60 repeat protein
VVRRLSASVLVPLAAVALVATVLTAPAVAVPGHLDPYFDADGRQTSFIHGATAYAVAIDARGRIVVAGYTLNRNTDVALARFLPNGQPDVGFGGGDGRATADLGGTDYAFDVAIADDGKIVVAGERDLSDHSQFAVARFGPGGVLDNSFSGDGRAFVDFGTKFQGANALAIGPGGKILIGGFTSNGNTGRWAMARFLPDGTLDPGFGGDGKVTTNLSNTEEQIEDLVVAPGGAITAAGYAEVGLVPRFAVAHYGSGGKLDPHFGSDGKNLIDVSRGTDIAYGIAQRSDGGFILVGYASHAGGNDWGMVAVTPQGRIDTTFGDGGHVITAFGPAFEYAYGVAIQPNGRIVVVGRASRASAEFCVIRYKAGGSPDLAFGAQGKTFTDFFGGDDTARGVALQTNGKIVVAGEAELNGVRRMAVARYLAA